MEIGIGLPNAVAGTGGRAIVDWARQSEDAGFSSLGTIDRLVYPNYEPLTVLAAAAAATERIGLVTSILLAPLRPTALLAKQAVSVDNVSGGRLTLGLAVGGREDDYSEGGVDFHKRGQIFAKQLDELGRLFRGEERGNGYPVVPEPVREGGPELIVGGSADIVFERAACYGSGWIAGGGGPDPFAAAVPKLERAWSAAGRSGKPRKLALAYFSLGDNAEEQARSSLGHYYAFLGEYAEMIAQGAAKTPDEIKDTVAAFEACGCDELIFFPASSDLGQIGLLREAL